MQQIVECAKKSKGFCCGLLQRGFRRPARHPDRPHGLSQRTCRSSKGPPHTLTTAYDDDDDDDD
eukprot:2641642-Pyramimonas_sp.AAC.1